MEATYAAAKELVINGKVYAKGDRIDPAKVPAAVIANGVKIGSITERKPAPPPAPAALAVEKIG